MRSASQAAAASLLLSSLLAAPAVAGNASRAVVVPRVLDWRTAIGGESSRQGFANQRLEGKPRVAWNAALPNGFCLNVVTADSRVFTADAAFPADPSAPMITNIVARDIRTGTRLWTVNPPQLSGNAHAPDVVAADGGVLYVTDGNFPGHVVALSEADGHVIWVSAETLSSDGTDSPAFTTDGDLIFGDMTSVRRIAAGDGTTVWRFDREGGNPGTSSIAVVGNRGYCLDAIFNQDANEWDLRIDVLDLSSGALLISSDSLSSGVPAGTLASPFTGPRGMVYAPITTGALANTLVALRDLGTSVAIQWRQPLSYVYAASFAVGPDGSVYAYSPDNRLVRIDPSTGDVIAKSVPYLWGDISDPRVVVDLDGGAFVAVDETFNYQNPNGGPVAYPGKGLILAFSPHLSLLWTDATLCVTAFSGIASGPGGMLIAAGMGQCSSNSDIVRAYSLGSGQKVSPWHAPSPNPVNGRGGH